MTQSINKYVHLTIQNKMMQTIVLRVLQEVAENIQDINVDFYAIMCDEATYFLNVSELVLCLRWVDNELEAHDEFIDLKNMPKTDADSIVQELKDVLPRMHLKLKIFKGQCYEGCSIKSS